MTIVLTFLLSILAVNLDKQIRKNFTILATLAAVLSWVSIWMEFELLQIITEGFLGLAFFVVVMYAGAFKKSSNTSKKLRSVRKEYSILGFVFLIPHFYIYLEQYLTGVLDWEWYGVVAMIIMIPLFISSFKFVKSKMNMKKWKSLQRWAYLAYALTFIHLIVVAEPQESIAYFIIFGVYSLLKLRNYVLVESIYKNIATLGALMVVVFLAVLNVTELTLADSTYDGTDYTVSQVTDGVYYGSGSGFQSLDVEVKVTVEDSEIIEIEIINCGCTSPHRGIDFEGAVDELADDIIAYQTTELDSISGATKSTEGLLEAVEDALNN